MYSFVLLNLICLPIYSAVLIKFTKKENELLIKQRGLICSFFIFGWSLLLALFFNNGDYYFQYFYHCRWFFNSDLHMTFGVDGVSLFFFILTSFLFLICFLNSWENITYRIKDYFIIFFVLEAFLFFMFSLLDIILFYFLFESILIPMFWIIGIWGSRSKKIKAAYLFFFYTVLSSLLFLLAIIYFLLKTKYTSYPVLAILVIPFNDQLILWIAFFLSFATKVPMVPFHIWLPEAHVEAPTTGSVLLAGILLKLGVYGFIRFLLPVFPDACIFYTPFVLVLALVGIIYTSLTAIRQKDLKRIIAYSSISHMNFVILGLCSFNISGIFGALFQSLSHGFVSSALFILIGFLYDRYHSRFLTYYGGLMQLMPLYSSFLLIFILSNISLPGTSSFIGEFLILLGIMDYSISITLISTLGLVFGSVYSLWLLNKLIYGSIKHFFLILQPDLTLREIVIIVTLFIPVILFGFCPGIILNYLQLGYAGSIIN